MIWITAEDVIQIHSRVIQGSGGMETVNRLTDVLVTMNTPADRGKLFKIIKMLYGLMGLPFSEEAEPMDADPRRFGILHFFLYGRLWRSHTRPHSRSASSNFAKN